MFVLASGLEGVHEFNETRMCSFFGAYGMWWRNRINHHPNPYRPSGWCGAFRRSWLRRRGRRESRRVISQRALHGERSDCGTLRAKHGVWQRFAPKRPSKNRAGIPDGHMAIVFEPELGAVWTHAVGEKWSAIGTDGLVGTPEAIEANLDHALQVALLQQEGKAPFVYDPNFPDASGEWTPFEAWSTVTPSQDQLADVLFDRASLDPHYRDTTENRGRASSG